jgi:hypothetical protein
MSLKKIDLLIFIRQENVDRGVMSDISITKKITTTITTDPFALEALASCPALRSIGVYCLLLFALSLWFNSVLLFLIIRNKEYKNSQNTYLCALIGLNLIGTLTELPLSITSNLYCR